MSELTFTPEELRLIQMFAGTPRTLSSRMPSWLFEIGVPIALALCGAVSHVQSFFGAGMGWLITLYAIRSFYQFKSASVLASACTKVLLHHDLSRVA